MGQVVLAWLLLPEDFGLIGLAYTVTAFTTLIQQAGVREVLIHRHRHFHRWATPAFWMSLATGVLAGLMMAGAAPFVAMAYGEQELVGLLLVLALVSPLAGASTVPQAALESKLRFGLLARIAIIENLLQTALTIGLAWAGAGVYSFVVPRPIVVTIKLVILWAAARPRVRVRPQVRRWPYLLGDTSATLATGVLYSLVAQGDYIILGALFSASTVGLYFFAYYISMQAVQLLASNLARVIFPALANLSDIRQQTSAFVRACGLISLVGTPLAILQAAVAEPVVLLLFSDQWAGVIPLIQILSIAAAFRIVLGACGSLLQAQGRFRFRLLLFTIYTPVFLMMVYAGAVTGEARGAAIGVSGYYAALGVFHLWLVIRPGGGRLRDAWGVYGIPILASSVTAAIGGYAAQWLPSIPGRELLQVLLTSAICLGGYAAIAYLLLPGRVHELFQHVAAIRRR